LHEVEQIFMTVAPRSAQASNQHLSRAGFRAASGVLLVLRDTPAPLPPVPGQPAAVPGNPLEGAEVLLAVWDDGSATGLHGHVDLGTGLRTALSQIVAEELNIEVDKVGMVMGSTTAAPNQGATIASASLQIHAEPLRRAAAQAGAWLRANGPLRAEQHVELMLDLQTSVKPPEEYRVVGQSVPRVDLQAKLTGQTIFVHDMRVPGMLHGRVIRPPYAGADHGDFIGNTLSSVDEASIAHIPGLRAVVVIRDFVGVIAEREEHAEQAMRELAVQWKPWPGMPDVQNVENALRNNPSKPRRLVNEGDVDAALAQGGVQAVDRTYVWPFQMHASIGPSCAVADWRGDGLTVYAGSQNPHVLRFDLSRLMGLPDVNIDVIRMEAAGCYGRNGADDVAADAALLSRAVGAPVRVQLTREQEHAWEPKGAAQLMQVRGGLNADGSPAGYDFESCYPSNGAPTLALLLTRSIEPVAQAFEMGDRTARPPYSYDNLRVTVNDMAPIVRASWLRGVSALPNSFAHESYIDELATAAGVDPVEYRLRHLPDPRAAELVRATADKAGWIAHTAPRPPSGDEWVSGQGFAYARYIHSKWPGFGAAWAAWVADVDVNRATGEVHVKRVVVGHDAGQMVNPAGVTQQVHGNVLQTTSRALKEQVQFEPAQNTVASQEWGSYPILNFREVPVIEVMHMPRQGDSPLGAGESSSVPGTAAIANAIFDATGVRFRKPPFTPEVVREGLYADPNLPFRHTPSAQAAIQNIALVGAVLGADPPPCAPAGVRQTPVGCFGRCGAGRAWHGRQLSGLAAGHLTDGRRQHRWHLQPRHHRAWPPAGRFGRLHGVPHERRRRRARAERRWWPRHAHALWHRVHHQFDAGRRNRHWQLVAGSLQARHARRHLARRTPPVPSLPLHRIRQNQRRRPDSALRVPDGANASARRHTSGRDALSVQPAPHAGGVERPVPRQQTFCAYPRAIRRVEPWRLPGSGAWPLRRLPHATQCLGRRAGRLSRLDRRHG
jgi:nicotinate dehydrogenase subunit B